MKKMTSVIAIILLAALLFTGCDFLPLKKDFSQYGFTFTIAGEVTEKEGNKFGNATLVTKYGEMTFYQHNALTLAAAELTLIAAAYKEPLDNGATLYTFNASDGIILTSYIIKTADDSSWQISVSTPEADYDKSAITKVFTSAKFDALQE